MELHNPILFGQRTSPFPRGAWLPFWLLSIVLCASFFFPTPGFGRIYIDINSPSQRKFKIAIPDFRDRVTTKIPSELATKLPAIISSDLDYSGYFSPMDKAAFLEEENDLSIGMENIRFKDWSVIGAELLLKGGYTCVGNTLEVEVRLFDVFWGREIFGKRTFGYKNHYHYMMHRLGNDIIRALTGHPGIFLTKLAFVGNGTGHKEIYVCDYDGQNVRQITADRSIALLPRWSFDGKKIAFNSYRDGGPKLYIMDIASGAVRLLSGREGLNIGASWSPDDKGLALTLSRVGNPDIFTIDLEGKITRRLTSHWGIDVSPVFSPDGKKITFVSSRSGSPQIYVMDLASGKEERVTFEGAYNSSPAWSSLNRIAFESMTNGHFDLYTMEPDGGQLKRLTENQRNNEDPCWSPDGRYIVFSSNREGHYHLYIMNSNGQNQKRITFLDGDQTAPSWGP